MAGPGPECSADTASAAASYLLGVQRLEDTASIARYTVEHAREATGAEWAELVEVGRDQQLRVLASSDPNLTSALMGLRQQSDGPPLPSAALAGSWVVIDDLHQDSPWPGFASAAVASTAVRSAVLSYAVDPEGSTATVLPVYDRRPGYFTPARQAYLRLLTELAGMALSRRRALGRVDQLSLAVESGRVVGTAVGIIAAGSGRTSTDAFELLRRTSQNRNRKLRQLAEDVIASGDLSRLGLDQHTGH